MGRHKQVGGLPRRGIARSSHWRWGSLTDRASRPRQQSPGPRIHRSGPGPSAGYESSARLPSSWLGLGTPRIAFICSHPTSLTRPGERGARVRSTYAMAAVTIPDPPGRDGSGQVVNYDSCPAPDHRPGRLRRAHQVAAPPSCPPGTSRVPPGDVDRWSAETSGRWAGRPVSTL